MRVAVLWEPTLGQVFNPGVPSSLTMVFLHKAQQQEWRKEGMTESNVQNQPVVRLEVWCKLELEGPRTEPNE